jgi:hypothetical protein
MCLALVACSSTPESAPDRVFVPPLGPYGWAHTFEPGATLTDGGPILEITTGPIRIISITIRASGAKVTVLGIYIRSLRPAVPFTGALGFPPDDTTQWRGAEPAVGAILDGPGPGEVHADFELLIGYRMPASGIYRSDGVVISYEYRGRRATINHPSQVVLCAGSGQDDPNCQNLEPD